MPGLVHPAHYHKELSALYPVCINFEDSARALHGAYLRVYELFCNKNNFSCYLLHACVDYFCAPIIAYNSIKIKSMLPQFFGTIRNYHEYYEWVKTLVAEGKTSGLEPTEARINFTALNLKRMERINKTYQPFDAFSTLVHQWNQRQIWVAIGEAWCGDCAQNYPAMAKISALFGDKIDLRLISRDDNPDFMQKHATNGSLSIPKLIAFDTEGKELFSWGPRPKPAQELLFAWKKDPAGRSHDDFELELHTWYAKDKCKVLEKEIFDLMQKCL